MAGAGSERVGRPASLTAFAVPRSVELRTAVVLQVVLLLMVVANLGRIPVFSTGERDAPILVNDIAVAVLIVTAGLAMLQQRSMRLDRTAFCALTFAALGLLSAVLGVPRFGLTATEVLIGLAYLARWLFYFAVYIVVINAVRLRDVDAVWSAFEKAVLIFAAFGIVQSALFPDFALMVYPDARAYDDWDPQGRRLVSTLLDPNFAGALILMPLLVHLGMLAAGARLPAWKPVLLFAALLLTLSRSSLLAFVVAGAVLLTLTGLSRRLLKWAAAVGVLLLAALPKLLELAASFGKLSISDASSALRIVAWLRGLQVFADNPVIGIGFNTWGFVQERYGWERSAASTYGLDGGLLFIAVLTGVVGLALYLGILGLAAARARRVWRDTTRSPEHRGMGAGVVAITVMIVVHSMFTNSILLPILMESLWVLWGLVAVIAASPVPPAGAASVEQVPVKISATVTT